MAKIPGLRRATKAVACTPIVGPPPGKALFYVLPHSMVVVGFQPIETARNADPLRQIKLVPPLFSWLTVGPRLLGGFAFFTGVVGLIVMAATGFKSNLSGFGTGAVILCPLVIGMILAFFRRTTLLDFRNKVLVRMWQLGPVSLVRFRLAASQLEDATSGTVMAPAKYEASPVYRTRIRKSHGFSITVWASNDPISRDYATSQVQLFLKECKK